MAEEEAQGSTDLDSDQKRRLRSGIPRLDYILKGGLIKGSIYSLYGAPGTGKTLLSNQFCFNHARINKGRCVYITIMVESVTKMLANLENLRFYDASCVNERVFYFSGYTTIKDGGFVGLLELVRKSLRLHNADVLVIDGLENNDPSAEGNAAYKSFLHELQALTHLMGCTTILTAAGCVDRSDPLNSLVDGVMELTMDLFGPRSVHEIRILKFRGSGYLQGKHEVEINDGGIQIHPRTEVQFAKPSGYATEHRARMALGVKGLDKMLGGGLLSGACTSVIGAPGTGKTTLGMSFLVEGARQGQSGVYFGFYEPPPRLIERADNLGLDLQKWVDKGLIEIIWQPPLEHYLDSLAEQLLEKLRQDGHEKRRRLFIDGIEGFRNANVYPERMAAFISAFTNQLRTLDVTSIISEEMPLFRSDQGVPIPSLANAVEGIIRLQNLQYLAQCHRLLSIMKMRDSAYDASLYEFWIKKGGIEVAESASTVEELLRAQRSPSAEATGNTRSDDGGEP